MVPSDWEAFNAHGPTNAATVADWQLALDAVVRAQGVFTFIFHPHGWIRSDQIIQFIDHAERTHGKKVKFLTFKEAVERLNRNMLQGHALREVNGVDNGVRALDVNNDGFMDFVWGTGRDNIMGMWKASEAAWAHPLFGAPIVEFNLAGESVDRQLRFGLVQTNGFASYLSDNSAGLPRILRSAPSVCQPSLLLRRFSMMSIGGTLTERVGGSSMTYGRAWRLTITGWAPLWSLHGNIGR